KGSDTYQYLDTHLNLLLMIKNYFVFSTASKFSVGGTVSLLLIPASISFLTVSFASLNSLTPLPIPRIRSGIFLPPKNKNTTKSIKIHSDPPGILNKNAGLKSNIIV